MNERHSVLLEIMCLSNCISRELSALNAERGGEGLSGMNAQILHYLAAREERDVFQRDLEEHFSVRRSTVSKVVQLMEEKDLLRREAVDRDARLKRLVLTDRARRILAVTVVEYEAFEARVTAGLTTDEMESLRGLLGKIGAALGTNAEKIEENL